MSRLGWIVVAVAVAVAIVVGMRAVDAWKDPGRPVPSVTR